MLFVGGSRAHHYQDLFAEIGMKTVAAGYEFAHRDDYEGRRVLPTIKVDADSRNIEELHVEADPARYRPRKTDEELQGARGRRPAVQRLRGHDARDGGRDPGDRRHQPPRDREAAGTDTSRTCSAPASRRSTPSRRWASPASSSTATTTAAPTPASRARSTSTARSTGMVNTRIWGYHEAALAGKPATLGHLRAAE